MVPVRAGRSFPSPPCPALLTPRISVPGEELGSRTGGREVPPAGRHRVERLHTHRPVPPRRRPFAYRSGRRPCAPGVQAVTSASPVSVRTRSACSLHTWPERWTSRRATVWTVSKRRTGSSSTGCGLDVRPGLPTSARPGQGGQAATAILSREARMAGRGEHGGVDAGLERSRRRRVSGPLSHAGPTGSIRLQGLLVHGPDTAAQGGGG